ncbi:MAG: hypothetical protein K9G41_03675 [Flavobacteriales bacterium]|nr:hypothetical protein [Flavobacteriales bacterium]
MEFLQNNRLAFHLAIGVLLSLVYPMQELFSGNQNIYFLWGMADLLPYTFAADPLLSTPNPYPLFSWLISIFPVQFLGTWTAILYVFLNAIYSFSIFGIADRIAPLYNNRTQLFSFLTFFLFLHSSPIWGTYFQLVFDVDLRWIWDSGIAEQGVLRGYLQPSMFGVFLLMCLYQAMQRNYALAILCIAPSATLHAGYLFIGGILTILILLKANFGKMNLLAAGGLLLLVLPYSYYIFNHFMQVDEGLKTAIRDAVMAGFDANLHINPINWLNAKFYFQLLIMLLGFVILWKTQLRFFILGITAIGLSLTTLAYGMDNTTLISLNPWRVSILIMPIATVAILSKIVSNGMFTTIRPHVFSLIGIVATALIIYRLFGNGADFLDIWKTIQIGAFIFTIIAAGFIFKNEILTKLLAPLVILALLVVGVVDHYVDGITKANKDEFKVISAINKTSEPNTIYIIPANWTSFRMNAQKAVFVDENLVYGPALPSLMERLDALKSTNNSNDFSTVVGSIAAETTIKLIAPSEIDLPSSVRKEAITRSYSCFTLRQ